MQSKIASWKVITPKICTALGNGRSAFSRAVTLPALHSCSSSTFADF